MLELTFNFPLGTFNLSFSEMSSPYSSRKAKRKEKKKKRRKRKKIEVKWGKRKERRKRKRKNFVCAPVFEKSILCDLMKTYLLIPLFTN